MQHGRMNYVYEILSRNNMQIGKVHLVHIYIYYILDIDLVTQYIYLYIHTYYPSFLLQRERLLSRRTMQVIVQDNEVENVIDVAWICLSFLS